MGCGAGGVRLQRDGFLRCEPELRGVGLCAEVVCGQGVEVSVRYKLCVLPLGGGSWGGDT